MNVVLKSKKIESPFSSSKSISQASYHVHTCVCVSVFVCAHVCVCIYTHMRTHAQSLENQKAL